MTMWIRSAHMSPPCSINPMLSQGAGGDVSSGHLWRCSPLLLLCNRSPQIQQFITTSIYQLTFRQVRSPGTARLACTRAKIRALTSHVLMWRSGAFPGSSLLLTGGVTDFAVVALIAPFPCLPSLGAVLNSQRLLPVLEHEVLSISAMKNCPFNLSTCSSVSSHRKIFYF